ncbi:MAG: hypothetical protein ACM3PO_11630 [Betaproteobacteria bacterium]
MFRSSLVASCFIALSLAPTAAQQPTQAQRDALRAACRSDFMADCASVQPGGKEALECLLRNEPKLSPPCRSAVNAIATPASGGVAPAPTAATPLNDASAAAQPAAAAPPATKTPATAPTRKTTTGTHATTTATSAAAGGSASTPTAAPAVAPLGPIRPMLPRRALMILAQCRPEQQTLCAGVPAGGGKILSCLAANAQQLSPACYQALARVSE